MEPYASWCDVFDDDGVTQLQEVLHVCTCVLARQTIELVCLHHRDQASTSSHVDSGSNEHVGNSKRGSSREVSWP